MTAAGAVPWRVVKDKLEVLLIHRPRYDDWSWPKGKIDDGETIPECAVREVQEEIGLTAQLGIPLPPIHYPVASGLKVVHYWAVKANGAKLLPDGKEVDSVMWCAPEKAAALLSNPSDVVPLQYLQEAHGRGHLDTWPLVVLRHAKAKPRSSWSKAEGERPLAATGTRQALTEHRHARSPKKTAAVIEGLFDKQRAVAVCTHRPALPTVFEQLAEHMPHHLRALLPGKEPYLSPGELVVCHVAPGGKRRIVAVEQFRPFDD